MKTYKKDGITVRENDDGRIGHYDKNGNHIYTKFPDGNESHYKYDKNGNCIYVKLPDGNEYHAKFDKNRNCIYEKLPNGKEYFYINNKPVTKEKWINHYINDNFDHRYIFDIIETLTDFNQNVNIQNIKKHLSGIEINNLGKKYEEVLGYWEILNL